MQRAILIVVLLAFSALTAVAILEGGPQGIFAVAFGSAAGMQLFFDLVIALLLFLVWMWGDAKATGRNPWPWIAITLAIGSFGPLLYLITRKDPAAAPTA
jgi:hypothetical protein